MLMILVIGGMLAVNGQAVAYGDGEVERGGGPRIGSSTRRDTPEDGTRQRTGHTTRRDTPQDGTCHRTAHTIMSRNEWKYNLRDFTMRMETGVRSNLRFQNEDGDGGAQSFMF